MDKNTDAAVTFLNFTEAHNRNAYSLFTNMTEHELGHQFLGDVYHPLSPGIAGSLSIWAVNPLWIAELLLKLRALVSYMKA